MENLFLRFGRKKGRHGFHALLVDFEQLFVSKGEFGFGCGWCHGSHRRDTLVHGRCGGRCGGVPTDPFLGGLLRDRILQDRRGLQLQMILQPGRLPGRRQVVTNNLKAFVFRLLVVGGREGGCGVAARRSLLDCGAGAAPREV